MFSQLKIKFTAYFFMLFVSGTAFCSATTLPLYDAGKSIFDRNCKVCHGAKGDGKTFVRNALKIPPASFTTEEARQKLSLRRMKRSISYGRSGTAMVSWQSELSSQDIDNVIHYIRTHFMKTDKDATEVLEKSYDDLAKTYSASLKKGRKIYQKHCYHCHGKKGDSKMPVNNGLKSLPRNFTDPLVIETLLPEKMFYSIRDGINESAMVSWKKEFSDREIMDIIKYIETSLMGKTMDRARLTRRVNTE